jgi:hypothetical protein
MNSKQAKEIVNEIFKNIFGVESKKSLEEVMSKFAFDIKLPGKVIDSTTGEETWAEAVNRTKFITNTNMDKYAASHGWMIPKRDVNSLEEVLKIWKKINYTTTERVYNSINVAESDTIYNCENIYRSLDLKETKNSIFCDGVGSSNFMLASQRTSNSNYCIRVDDSSSCSNSYNVICSAKISNSFFIQDCSNLYECMFCSHIANKRFCIANMQFEEEEYYEIKREIIKWILSN